MSEVMCLCVALMSWGSKRREGAHTWALARPATSTCCPRCQCRSYRWLPGCRSSLCKSDVHSTGVCQFWLHTIHYQKTWTGQHAEQSSKQSSVECRSTLTEVVILNLEVFSHDEKDFPCLRVHVHVTDTWKAFIKSECHAMHTVTLI